MKMNDGMPRVTSVALKTISYFPVQK